MKIKIIKRAGSENARAVAIDVAEQVRKGQKVNLGETILKHGYSESVAKRPSKVTQTKSYHEAILELQAPLQEELAAILVRMAATRNKATYKELVDGLSATARSIHLLFDSLYQPRVEEALSEEEKEDLRALMQRARTPRGSTS